MKTGWQRFWLALGLGGAYAGGVAGSLWWNRVHGEEPSSFKIKSPATKQVEDTLKLLQNPSMPEGKKKSLAADTLVNTLLEFERVKDDTVARKKFAEERLDSLSKLNRMIDSLGIKGDVRETGKQLEKKLRDDCTSGSS